MSERFDLLEIIGKGGMGIVWKARDNESGEVIALKLLHELYVDDADYVARLEREVEIARRIESPHVVKVLGYGQRNGVPYVAMEYIEGASLREMLRERGTLPWDEAKRILRETAEGLAAVHAADVIHRDIKPSNILIASDGTVKLADFGIARAGNLTQMTSSSTLLGTPAYMAPDIDASERSDLYGLGCVLFEMLAGLPPFPGDSQQQVFLRHIREAPDVAKLPPEARPIASWLLAKDPARRAPTAAALVAALAGSSKHGRHTPGVARGRWQRVALVVVPVLLLVGGVGALAYAGSGGGGGGHAAGSGGGGGGHAAAAVVATATATATGVGIATPTRVGQSVLATSAITSTPSPSPTAAETARTTLAMPPTPAPTPRAPAPATPTATPTPIPTSVATTLSAPIIDSPANYSISQHSVLIRWRNIPVDAGLVGLDMQVCEAPPYTLVSCGNWDWLFAPDGDGDWGTFDPDEAHSSARLSYEPIRSSNLYRVRVASFAPGRGSHGQPSPWLYLEITP